MIIAVLCPIWRTLLLKRFIEYIFLSKPRLNILSAVVYHRNWRLVADLNSRSWVALIADLHNLSAKRSGTSAQSVTHISLHTVPFFSALSSGLVTFSSLADHLLGQAAYFEDFTEFSP